MNIFIQISTVIAIFVAIAILSLILITIGWEWFMVPVFGMASLTMKQTIGFVLLASTIRSYGYHKK